MGPTVAQVRFQESHKNDMVIMVTKVSPSLSQAEWCKFCTHVRHFNVCRFKKVEANGLKMMASR
jgi:hypothetical protein